MHQTLGQFDPQVAASNPRFDWRKYNIFGLYPLGFYRLRWVIVPLLL
jgi:hypothetical protein